MKTSTLRHLMVGFDNARRYHLTSALLERDLERQSRALCQADKVRVILSAIRFELATRAAHDARSADDAKRADHYLQRLLEDFLDASERDNPTATPNASPDPTNAIIRSAISLLTTPGVNAARP